jgi:hypothetical protein
MNEANNDEERSNVELIYDYTGSLYQSTSSNLASLDTRLATIIGFGGLLLRFSGDLLADNWWQLTIKLVTGVLIAVSACVALQGFLSKPSGTLIKPEALLNKWYYISDEECRLLITRELAQTIEELNHLREYKSRRLNCSVRCLVAAVLTFGLSIWLASIFS